MQNAKLKKILEIAAVIIFFSAFVLSLSKPIADPDVFWHLKTGEWICQNKTLPDKDLFSFTVEPYQYEISARISFILKQYWLAQLIIYGLYSLSGFYGIIIFRCLIYLSIVLLLYHWIRKKGLSRLTTLICLIPSIWFSIYLLGERPNNLSFLFAVIVVYLLEDLKGRLNSYKSYSSYKSYKSFNYCNFLTYLPYCNLPLVMVIWANMHGGFILGDAIIILYMIAEGLKRVNRVNRVNETFETSGTFLTFFIVCLISILVSFVNPNTYKVIFAVFELEGTYYSASISETMTPFKYAEMGNYQYLIGICTIGLIFLLRIKQLKLNTALLISFLVLLALTRVRYIPFLLFISVPFIVEIWRGFFDGIAAKAERFYTLPATRYTLYAIRYTLPLLFVIFLVSSQMKLTVFKRPVISLTYPEAAIKFVKREMPEPEIFNDFRWGGYLIWSLCPDYKVFIDGRGLVLSFFITYNTALSGSVKDIGGVPEWKAIMDTYRVKTVLVPGSNIAGGFVRLVRRLVDDKEWRLVFVDKEALIFLKDTGRNSEIIKKYSLPKVLAYIKALEQTEFYRTQHPDKWTSYATLGEINLYLGRPKVALLNFESAFKLNPSLRSTSLGKLIEEVKAGRDYSRLLDKIFR